MTKVCFASDFHLGVPDYTSSREREAQIVRWLQTECRDADVIVLLGDVFDFWFEYKKVVPKGYVRLLGALAEICDRGVEVYMFRGNHDMWMFGYLEKEVGVKLIDEELISEWNGRKIYMHHGDGLGPGDYSYKFIRKVFRNRICQRLFAAIPPTWGMGLAEYLSSKSRINGNGNMFPYYEPNEWLLQYCKDLLKKDFYDYMIFGHRHLKLDIPLEGGARYINLGEWVTGPAFAVLDQNGLRMHDFK